MKDELYLVIGIGLLLLVIFSFGLILNGGGGTGGGSTTTDANIGLIDLNDGDSTYSGHGGQFVQALPSEDGWRFIDVNAVSLPDTNATCTLTVSSANADYTNPSDALDAIKSTGGRICIGPGTYQLTRPMDINGNSIEIVGSGVSTVIRTNPISIPTAIQIPTGSQTTYILLSNLSISASSSLGNGTAIDFSNCAICKIRDIYINGYNHGIDFNKSNTFYNTVENARISVSGPGAFGIRFQNSANDNTVFRTRILADGNVLGVTIKNAHGNSLYEVNVESLAYIGIDINTGANDTSVYAPYLESNNINLSIASGVYGFYLSGGSIQSGATANIQDLGAEKPVMTGMKLGFASAPSVFGDINATGDINADKNIWLNGDLYAKDENTYIGNPTSPFNNDIIVNALQLVVTMSTRGANMIINGNTYAFCVLGTNPCSGMYFSSSDGIRGFRLDIAGVPIWYIGTGGGSGVTFQGSRTSNPTTGSGAGLPSSTYILNTVTTNRITDGNIPVINQGTLTGMDYARIGSKQIDLNLGMKINHQTGTDRCAGMAVLASGTVTVNTTCMEDENSMVNLTKQGKIGAGVTPIQVENKISGTSFDIRDSNTAGDANVFWTISKLYGI